MTNPSLPCPCGRSVKDKPLSYKECCEPYHLGSIPPDPESLMRSRYSAFVLKRHQYLIDTHHHDYLNGLSVQILDQENHTHWLALSVNKSSSEQNKGMVEFHAWYRAEDGLDAIHEISDFVKQDGRWWYTQGEQLLPKYPKRNDPCVCQSGKKFKQCCLK
ncbi:YchJ family protein [Shewanella sp. Isolate7]|uniref:YchJ family protein n=1 Tax=Shewanella sp. Isolate7 TaxID=2908528 RepID=UPI001EFD1B0D|nr:YchJ family protein [Shewanella sp. Isolate7]MCG9721167.1 YchJ family protein [Shewanella sp. Isolate7]